MLISRSRDLSITCRVIRIADKDVDDVIDGNQGGSMQ
jgi:hypothetical protein